MAMSDWIVIHKPGKGETSTHTAQVTSNNFVKKTGSELESPRRASIVKLGVQRAGMGGVGRCGSCDYIHFQEQAFARKN